MAPRTNLPTGVHRVRATLSDGTRRFYFSLRGVPNSKFFQGPEAIPTNAEFHLAYARALEGTRHKPKGETTESVVDDFISSVNFQKLAPRTKIDYRRWLDRFTEEFGADPIKMFEEQEAAREVEKWRENWNHSPKQYDYAGTVVTLFLNWAANTKHLIRKHYCTFSKVYEADRAHITWLPQHVDRVLEIAPDPVKNLLIAATETGMRPQDLVKLDRFQIENTKGGNRRVRIRTQKRGRPAYIPVTEALAAVIDGAPAGREFILATEKGHRWTPRYASQKIKDYRNKAGLTEEKVGYALRLQDCRGTAATRLLEAGAGLFEIATVTGWSVRYAGQMIETYAVVTSDKTDRILAKLETAKKNKSGT